MADGAGDDDKVVREAKALPLPERLAHSHWRVRADAYADVGTEASSAADTSSASLSEFGVVAVKVVGDSNPNALDAGLDALNAFLLKADEEYASRFAAALASNLASKGLTARPKTVTRASDALLLLIELDAAEATVDALFKGLQGKLPKGVAACVAVLLQAVRSFGPRVIKPSPVLKACSPLLDHKDKSVRDGAKELAVELTRWLGAAAVKRDFTDKMRDAQKKEVEEALEAVVADVRPTPTRYLRKDPQRTQAGAPAQAGVERTSSSAAASSTAGGASAAAPRAAAAAAGGSDVYDLMEPEDILTKLGKRDGDKAPFLQAASSEKWKERLAAFTDLRELAAAPRIAPGNFGEITSTIKRVLMKDANVAVVTEAACAAAALSVGLRREYRSDARILTAPLLEKFKEKNTGVIRAVHSALSAFSAHSYALTDVADDLMVAFEHKVPAVQVESLNWFGSCLAAIDKAVLAKLDNKVLFGVLKNTEASAPAVRDAALVVLAAAFKVGADLGYLNRAIDTMEPARKKKLQSLISGETAPPETSRPSTASAAEPARAAAKPAAAAAPARTLSSAAGSRPAKPAASAARSADDDAVEPTDAILNADEIAYAVESLIGGGHVARLSSADWKERLEAVGAIADVLAKKDADVLTTHSEVVIRQFGNAPGWEERNFQVTVKCFEILAFLARSTPEYRKQFAMISMEAVVSKVADPKLKTAAADVLTAWSEAVGPKFVVAQLYKRAAAHKNPKVLELALAWCSYAFVEFGGRSFDMKVTINAVKECISHTNPGVKAAAVTLLGSIHTAYGAPVKAFLTDVKPALMPVIDAELVRCPHDPAAMDGKRLVKSAAAAPARAPAGAAAGSTAAAPPNAALSATMAVGASVDGLPREDISALLTSKLIKEVSSPDWKVRQASLDAIETIINEAGRRITPNIGPDLITCLKARFSDANKMLIIVALRVVGLLAEALGSGAAERVCRPLMPDMLKPLGDQKKQVREAVTKTLDALVQVMPLERMLPAVTLCISDAKFPADGRRDAFVWLAGAAKATAPGWDYAPAFTAASVGLVDKASEVREAAALLASALATAAGPEAAARAVRSLPKQAQAALTERLGASLLSGEADSGPVPTESAPPTMRPATAPVGAGARGAASSALRSSRAGPLPTAPAPAAVARTASVPAGGPMLMLSPAERKDERIAKLPRKALGSVGGKDFAADVRDAGSEELAAVAAPYFRDELRARMFTEDFKKHIEAAELLEAALGEQLEEVISVLDILFRWAVHRFCELAPNTSSLLRVLDWLSALFEALRVAGYRLREEEAVLLLPIVLEKSGHNLPAVRERFRKLMRAACGLYPVSKFVAFLGSGLSSKNNRSRVECLEELAAIIDRHGVEVAERAGAKVLPGVVPLVTERDATLRKSALEVLCAAYRAAGDGVWRYLGKVPDAQREAIEGTFKKTARDLAAKGESRPGSVAPTAGALGSDDVGGRVPQRPATAAPGAARSPSRAGLVRSPSRASPTRKPAAAFVPPPSPMPPTPMELTRMPHDANASRDTLAADWANAVATLVSTDEQASVAAMKTVCFCLKNLSAGEQSEDIAAIFAADADKLVALLAAQVARSFEAAASAAVQPAPSRACKYVLNALMQTFSVVRMARAVAEPTVRGAIGELLLRLLDDRVPRIEEGGQLVRALNLLMLKILENANRTSSFVALLFMLRKPPAALLAPDAERRVRFSDLVVKCLIKLTRTLGGSLAGLDISEVLLTIHSFFMVLGVDEIRRRGADDDRPLRMVKTVLYELTKVLGPGINAHLTKVPPPTFEPTPLIYAYIQLNLQSLAASGVIAPGTDAAVVEGLQSLDATDAGEFGTSTLGSTGASSVPPTTPSHDLKTQLAAIFRKIGDKATTAEGIEELFAFKQEQPGIDITPHLAKTSDAFQLYIQRGLAKVEASRSAGDLAAMARGPSPSAEPAAPQSAAEAYQERLQRVKAAHAAGLTSSASFPSGAMQQSALAGDSAAGTAPPVPGSRQNLDALRERMRSIAAKGTTELPAARPTTAPVAASVAAAPDTAESSEQPAAAPARPGVSLSELQARMARIRELSQGNAS